MKRMQIVLLTALLLGAILACSAPGLATPTPVPTNTPLPTPTPTATPTAFPTPTATPTPVMISSGLLEIPQSYQADLDSGIVPRDPKSPVYADVDLWYDAVSDQERYLEAYNGASMLIMGPAPADVTQCQNTQAQVARADVNSLPPGTYICFRTNIGNTAVVRVQSIDPWSPGSMRLEYQTWHQP